MREMSMLRHVTATRSHKNNDTAKNLGQSMREMSMHRYVTATRSHKNNDTAKNLGQSTREDEYAQTCDSNGLLLWSHQWPFPAFSVKGRFVRNKDKLSIRINIIFWANFISPILRLSETMEISEIRVLMKYEFHRGATTRQAVANINSVFGIPMATKSTVARWFQKFRSEISTCLMNHVVDPRLR
ncbi:hypothetical protein NPIL_423031 [Nephila pilipes]|uniref:Mos1 transposase HTH domain-containing protein n=1 Tax=Nephila pilipes TaxID=299642 RepID=A0A8X6PGX8_NEPPI|nr:hypothetical protein NPIL_423031 [Nephila pilipes]